MNRLQKILGFREIEEEYPDTGWTYHELKPPPWWRILLMLFVVLGVPALLVFWQRHAIRQYTAEWTAENHYEEAVEAWEVEQYGVALRRALTSDQLEPGNYDTQKLIYKAARETGDYRLLQFGQQFFFHEEATESDKAETMAALVDTGDARSFARIYHEVLTDDQREHPDIHFQWLRYRFAQGKIGEIVEGLAKIAPGLRAESPRYDFLEMRAHFADDEASDSTRGKALALLFLDSSRRFPDQDYRGDTLALLESLPPARFAGDSLEDLRRVLRETDSPEQRDIAPTLAFSLKLADAGEDRERILSEAIAALQPTRPEELMAWLLEIDEYGQVVDLWNTEEALRSPEIHEAIARSLVATERFDEALDLLRYPPENSDRIGLAALRAQVHRELRDKPGETSAWREALLEADKDRTRNEYLRVAQLASEVRNLPILADALVAASQHPLGSLPKTEEIQWLFGYLLENHRTEDLQTVTQRLLSRDQNPILVNNALYLSILSSDGEAVSDEMVEVGRRLREIAPQYPQIRNTLALLLCLQEQGEEALSIYRESEWKGMEWHQFSPTARATLAYVLALNGPIDPFPNVAAQINWNEMSAAERRFYRMRLDPFLKRQGSAIETAREKGKVPEAEVAPEGARAPVETEGGL